MAEGVIPLQHIQNQKKFLPSSCSLTRRERLNQNIRSYKKVKNYSYRLSQAKSVQELKYNLISSFENLHFVGDTEKESGRQSQNEKSIRQVQSYFDRGSLEEINSRNSNLP